jgi:hypothetical protein
MNNIPEDEQAVELTQRQEIERLFAEFELAVEPRTIFDLQSHLAHAISAAEPVAFRDKGSPQRDHLRRLRLLGDGLAWRLLHPYTIRQLAKNQGGAQAVSTQAGFAATLRLAEQEAAQGHPVLVCDLTNCLRVGDVVVCSDPERPRILESGGHPRFKHKGRKGRQHRRAQAITELLQSGGALLHGDAVPTETIEIAQSPVYSWPTVERVVLEALREGEAWAQHGPGDTICATRAESEDFRLPQGLKDAIDAFEQAMVGFVTMLQKPNLRVPPATAWPISAAARLGLLQSDVFLVHAVDLGAFRGEAPGGEFVTVNTKGQAVTGFEVRAAGVIHHMAPHFLDDVVLGFQTIESTRVVMVALGMAAVASSPDGPVSQSDLASVESPEEAQALLRDPERLRATGYVSMPFELFEEISALAGEESEARDVQARSAPADDA